MTNGKIVTTVQHIDQNGKTEHTIISKQSDDENTTIYHGGSGANAPHYTGHSDGSRWKTAGDGSAPEQVSPPSFAPEEEEDEDDDEEEEE